MAIERVLRPGYFASAGDRAFVNFFVLAAGFFPLFAVILWPYVRGVAVGQVVGGTFAVLYLAVFLVAIAQLARLVPGALRGDKKARTELIAQAKGVGMLLFIIGSILVVAVPQLTQFRGFVGAGLIGILYLVLLVSLNRWLLGSIKELTGRPVIHYLTLGAPFGLAIWWGFKLLESHQADPSEVSLLSFLEDFVTAVGGVYAVAIAGCRGIIWLLRRFWLKKGGQLV
jgi:hypothetical protein